METVRSVGAKRATMKHMLDRQSLGGVGMQPPRRLAPVSQREGAMVSEYEPLTSMGRRFVPESTPPTRRVALVKPLKRDGSGIMMTTKLEERSVDPLLQRLEEQAKTNQRTRREPSGYHYGNNNNAEDSNEDVTVHSAKSDFPEKLSAHASSQLRKVKKLRYAATPMTTEWKSSIVEPVNAVVQDTVGMHGTTLARYRRLVGMVARKCVMSVKRSAAQQVVHLRLCERSARIIQFEVSCFLRRRARERSAKALQRVWRRHVARQGYVKMMTANKAKVEELAQRRRVLACRCIERWMRMHFDRQRKMKRINRAVTVWIHERGRKKAEFLLTDASSIDMVPASWEDDLHALQSSQFPRVAHLHGNNGDGLPHDNISCEQAAEVQEMIRDVAKEAMSDESQHASVDFCELVNLCEEKNEQQFCQHECSISSKNMAAIDPMLALVDATTLSDKMDCLDKKTDEANMIACGFPDEKMDLVDILVATSRFDYHQDQSFKSLDVVEDKVTLASGVDSRVFLSEIFANALVPADLHHADRTHEWRLVFSILQEHYIQSHKRKKTAAIKLQGLFRRLNATKLVERIRERAIQSLEAELKAHLLSTQQTDCPITPWGSSLGDMENGYEMRLNNSTLEPYRHPYLPTQNGQTPPGVSIDREPGERQALWTWSWKTETWESLLMRKTAR